MYSSTPVSGPSSSSSQGAVERRDRESDDEKKDKLRRFTKGLQQADAQRGAAARAIVPAAPKPPAPDAKKSAAGVAKPTQADERPVAGEGASAPVEADGAEVEGVATEGRPEPEDALLVGLARKAVTLAAKKALQQRALQPVSRSLTPESTTDVNAAAREVVARQTVKEKKAKETVVEESRRDPQAALASQHMSSGAVAETLAARPAEPLPQGHPVDPATFRQMVEFAAIHRDRSGVIEFQLGLRQGVLGGAQIVMRSYGDRKIGLRVKNGVDGAVTKDDLEALVRSLRSRDLDVVEVEVV